MPPAARQPKPVPEPIVITGQRWRLVAFFVLMIALLVGAVTLYVVRTENTRSTVDKIVKPSLCQEGNDASCIRLLNRLCRERKSCSDLLDRLLDSATPAQSRRILKALPELRARLKERAARGQGGAARPGTRQRRGPNGRVIPSPDDVPNGDQLDGGNPQQPDNGGGGGGGGSNPSTPSLPNVPNLPNTPDTPDLPDTPELPRPPLLPSVPEVLGGVGDAVDGLLPERVCVLAACTESAPAPAP